MTYQTAFVLGGGGHLDASEVGMLRALRAAGIRPDLVLGTSIGAINGAIITAEPAIQAVEDLTRPWTRLGGSSPVFGGSLLGRIATLARSRTHGPSNAALRERLTAALPVQAIEDLVVSFQYVAASIEQTAGHPFTSGPPAEAVLASSAVPGLLPPVKIGDEHFLDGGLVNSIPVGRAVALGARTVYVLHVGRIEQPLRAPRLPWQVAAVAFEIARRHRFARDMAELPPDVTVHVLPAGQQENGSGYAGLAQLRYKDSSRAREQIDGAHQASAAYLARIVSAVCPGR